MDRERAFEVCQWKFSLTYFICSFCPNPSLGYNGVVT
jgi:hypothetical protein